MGNPNVGKSSLFNKLTGLQQKTANFPGVTVDKKSGRFSLPQKSYTAELVDLPGSYSLIASSPEEELVTRFLLGDESQQRFDLIVFVADVLHLKRSLFLFSQIKDLGYPIVLVLTMSDLMSRYGVTVDVRGLEKSLAVPTFLYSAQQSQHTHTGQLKSWLVENSLKVLDVEYVRKVTQRRENIETSLSFDLHRIAPKYFEHLRSDHPDVPLYPLWLRKVQGLNQKTKAGESLDTRLMRRKEIALRYEAIESAIQPHYRIEPLKARSFQGRLDRFLLHPIYGVLFFLGVLFLVFNAIYSWSSYPMDLIDSFFSYASVWMLDTFPSGRLTDLLAKGVFPGLGGVLVFVPQIAFLFLFIGILEQSGFMSRLIFLSDDLLRPFGLSGRSVIPFMSGVACAIPAVMSARAIENWKERLIVMLTTPFITCSARLPVYLIIIALVIPDITFYGFQLRGLVLMVMYLLGILVALLASFVLHKFLKSKTLNRGRLIMEMPLYRWPLPHNLFYVVLLKVRDFSFNAGKIILAISIVLWFLASHGPSSDFDRIDQRVQKNLANTVISQQDLDREVESLKLKSSYIGHLGRWIEPVVLPLGYDWKLGIALISSFAAREVFVGTLATIYRVGGDDEKALLEAMKFEVNEKTGQKTFNLAMGISLLIFYALAMQCMSTVAVVRRETRSWKWAIFQLVGMNLLAYLGAFCAYQFLV